jgi:preprotein translocase subunit SecE
LAGAELKAEGITVAGERRKPDQEHHKPFAGYKPEQGRYVRMAAFWSLFAFWSYGCYRLQFTLQGWFAGWFPAPRFHPGFGEGDFVQLPLVGGINLATIVTLVVFAVGVYLIHRILNRPKVADLLIETETELRKVTWPSRDETLTASVVVIATVVILVAYLWVADLGLAFITRRIMG